MSIYHSLTCFFEKVNTNLNFNSILEELIAGSIVAMLFSIFFPFWLRKIQKPGALIIEFDPVNDDLFEERGELVLFDIELMLSNDHRVLIDKPIFWKIIVPSEIKIKEASEGIEIDDQGEAVVFKGKTEDPLYPNRALNIASFKGSFKKSLQNPIFYYEISSQFGLYPQSMKKFYRNTPGFSFSDEVYKNLGKLPLVKPD